jgi:hypothetical protein
MIRHEHAPPEEHRVVHGKIVVDARIDLPHLRHILDAAVARTPAVLVAIPGLLEALGDTAAAGRAHQAWAAIERVGLRS